MKKKFNPKDYSKNLREAQFEFLQRNKKVKNCFNETVIKFKNDIPEHILIKCLVPPAVRAFRYRSKNDFINHSVNLDYDFDCALPLINEDYESIIKYLTNTKPEETLILGIDLNKPKKVILAEVKEFVDRHKIADKSRDKWLTMKNEILEVWDLYKLAGKQSAKLTFSQISRKVNRPLSTVKDQWRKAYELIYRTPYNPDMKYSSEEKKIEATDICKKCPHITSKKMPCYKGGEFYPCIEYLEVAGKERKQKTAEYQDNILYEDLDY